MICTHEAQVTVCDFFYQNDTISGIYGTCRLCGYHGTAYVSTITYTGYTGCM